MYIHQKSFVNDRKNRLLSLLFSAMMTKEREYGFTGNRSGYKAQVEQGFPKGNGDLELKQDP